jgi:uncharacterized membrane protein YhaH (DUF805 family)
VVLLLCWAQPLLQQFWGAGPGNIGQILGSPGGQGDPVGPRLGTRLMGRVVADPPFFLRPSFHDGWLSSKAFVADPVAADAPLLVTALASLGLVLAVLVGLALVARRRRDRAVVLLLATAVLAILVAEVSAVEVPLGYFGVPLHLFRWMWVVSAFATLAVVVALVRLLPRGAIGAATAVLTVVAVGLSVANLPTSDQGTIAPEGSIEAVKDLDGQLGRLEGSDQTYLVDLPPFRFNDPYGAAVMAELQQRGIPFVVEDGMDRQVGSFRRLRRGNADAALRLVVGDEALHPGAGVDRVAFHDPLGARGRRRLEEASDAVALRAQAGQLRLNARGQAQLAAGQLPWWKDRYDAAGAAQVLADRRVLFLLDKGWLEHDAGIDRYAELQRRSDNLSVAVLLDRLTAREEAGKGQRASDEKPCQPWFCP